MGLLQGKVALVTGAARGIGRAIALRYAQEGADVAVIVRTINDNSKSLEEALAAFGGHYGVYVADVSSYEAVHEAVSQVHKDFGHIDVLVSNAGITRDGLMLRMDEAQWDDVISANLKSAFNCVHAMTPIMARQRSGSIICMSSVVGISGNAGQTNYAASKAGIIGLVKSIAKEMGSRGIRANCIAPGFIQTDMTASLSPEAQESMVKSIPLRRAGTPEDVAGVAVFLASDMSAYVTGQVLSCCGGLSI